MFTGLIETVGRVAAAEAQPFGQRLAIEVGAWRGRSGTLTPGASIAVNGACLSIAEATPPHLAFDVIAETLAKTALGELKQGDAVNLESALTAATPIDGHFVQGHVDGVGQVVEVRGGEAEHVMVIHPPSELLDYLVPKGSIAIDGVSLTISALREETFEVALIPTTLNETTLGALREGDRVNLEADTVAKTVVHWLRRHGEQGGKGGGVTWQTLREAGFVASDG